MRGSPFFQKKTHYGLAVILVIILLSSLFDSREHFNLHIKCLYCPSKAYFSFDKRFRIFST